MPKTSRSMPLNVPKPKKYLAQVEDISKSENIRTKADPAYAARKTRKFMSDMKARKQAPPIKPLAKKKGGK